MMEHDRVCPFMSTADKKVACLKEKCQIWFTVDQERESTLNPANCALAHLPLLALEVSGNTRLMRESMVESIAL